MRWGDAVDEIKRRSSEKGKPVPKLVISRIMREFCNLIIDVTLDLEDVRLQGFGEFRAYVNTNGLNNVRSRYVRVTFRKCAAWKRRALLEKYGYEPDKSKTEPRPKKKVTLCPICGRSCVGRPLVCPECGSAPFEKQEEDDA
jgi:hypothetical protein